MRDYRRDMRELADEQRRYDQARANLERRARAATAPQLAAAAGQPAARHALLPDTG